MISVDWVQWLQPLDESPPYLPADPEVRVVRRAGLPVANQYWLSGTRLRGVRDEVLGLVVDGVVPGLTRVDFFIDLPIGSTEFLAESLRRGMVRLEGARGFRVYEEYRGRRVGRTVYFGHTKSLVRVYCGSLKDREAERLERQTRGTFVAEALEMVRRGQYNAAVSGPVRVGGLPLGEFLQRGRNVSDRWS